jgi:hypothetical protein
LGHSTWAAVQHTNIAWATATTTTTTTIVVIVAPHGQRRHLIQGARIATVNDLISCDTNDKQNKKTLFNVGDSGIT